VDRYLRRARAFRSNRGSARLGDPTRWCGDLRRYARSPVAVDVRGGNERREAGSCTARGTSGGWVCWEPRMRRTPLRRGLEAGHGARRDRRAVRRWLLVPCWRPQGNVYGAREETVKISSRAGHCARGQRPPHHLADTVFSALALPPSCRRADQRRRVAASHPSPTASSALTLAGRRKGAGTTGHFWSASYVRATTTTTSSRCPFLR